MRGGWSAGVSTFATSLVVTVIGAGCSGSSTPGGPLLGVDSGLDGTVPDALVGDGISIVLPPEDTAPIGLDAATDAGSGCGDGVLQAGEHCDDGNHVGGDGCSSTCRLEAFFVCDVPGTPCRSTQVCGDAERVGNEACDDGNALSGDGCSSTCTIEAGFACPLVGAPCAEVCGDSRMVGRETCDDGNTTSGDGCSAACQLEKDSVPDAAGRPRYWTCTVGSPCTRATCGDGVRQGAEPCDDHNDRPGDGCSPKCELEPLCTTAGCTSRCGDGIMLPGDVEACDDGNTLDGDGCDAQCRIEVGYTCPPVTTELPAKLFIPVVYRDFVGAQRAKAGAPTHPDFESTRGADDGTPGLVKATLNASGLPELTGLCVGAPAANGFLTTGTDARCPTGTLNGSATNYIFNQMTSASAFAQWFTDVPAVNRTIVSQLCLKKQGTSNSYIFDSKTDNPSDCSAATTCDQGKNGKECWFLPINGQGFVKEGLELERLPTPEKIFGAVDPVDLVGNFSFTSVVRTWFIYNGGEQLSFSGDDDVWVFINRQLAVDLGGLHSILPGSVTLDGPTATKLGLTTGHVYEMTLFHAERYGYGSNFKLTLTGFSTTHSACLSTCGDGIRVGQESCDRGADNRDPARADAYGACTTQCELGPRCGDGVVQADHGEVCDEPSAQVFYSGTPIQGCTPTCQRPGSCGDGILQAGYEECDDGPGNVADTQSYNKCTTTCRLGPYCGDGKVNGDEQCDEGAGNGTSACGLGCRPMLQ